MGSSTQSSPISLLFPPRESELLLVLGETHVFHPAENLLSTIYALPLFLLMLPRPQGTLPDLPGTKQVPEAKRG